MYHYLVSVVMFPPATSVVVVAVPEAAGTFSTRSSSKS